MSHSGTSSNASIKAIDKTSIHRITSGQVVIDLQTAVKELVENSLDAHATSIEVRFRQYGLSSIEVVDDGCGIAEEDYDSIGLKHHTSKLATYDDLTTLQTFGFRGEALSSLCALCQSVSVTTSTQSPMGVCLDLDTSGRVKSRKTVARPKGTTITLKGLFHPLPVRRKELEKNIKREFTKALGLLNAYALLPCTVDPGIRLIVSNQPDKGAKSQLLSTPGTPSVHASVTSLWGPKSLDNIVDLDMEMEVERERGNRRLQALSVTDEEPLKVKVKGLISKFSVSYGRAGTDRQFFYINGRPCALPKVQKAFNEVYRSFNATQSPFVVADFILPKDALDVNVSPDKRTIFLDSEGNLIAALKSALESQFNPARSILDITSTQVKTTQTLLDKCSFSKKVSAPVEPDETNDALENNTTTDKSNIPEPLAIATSNIQSSSSDINTSTTIPSQTPLFLHDPDEVDEDATIQNVHQTSMRLPTSEKPAGGDEQEIIVDTLQASWNRAQHIKTSDIPSQQTSQQTNEEFHDGDDIELSQDGPVRKKRKSEAQASPLIDIPRTPDIPSRLTMQVTKNLSTTYKKGTGHRTQPTSRDKIRKGQLSMHKYLAGFASDSAQNTVNEGVDDEISSNDVLANEQEDVEMVDVKTSEYDPDIVISEPVTDATDDAISTRSGSDAKQSSSRSDPPEASSIKSTGDAMDDASESDEDASSFISTSAQRDLSVESLPIEDITAVSRLEIIRNEVDGNDVTLMFDFTKVQSAWTKYGPDFSQGKATASVDANKVETLEEAGLMNTEDEARAIEILSRIIDKADFATMDVIGQFNLGFVIARRRKTDPLSRRAMDDLFIIDQHAADEKYNFETLQQTTNIQSQKLFRPQVLELTASDELVATENIDMLRKNGFEVDMDQAAQSGSRLKLTAQPVSKATVFDMKDLEELIHLMRELPTGQMIRCSKARSMFAMRACRKSVMVGMPLNRHQMGNVVKHMGMIDQPWNCPHGRPTMRHLVDLDGVKRDHKTVNWKGLMTK